MAEGYRLKQSRVERVRHVTKDALLSFSSHETLGLIGGLRLYTSTLSSNFSAKNSCSVHPMALIWILALSRTLSFKLILCPGFSATWLPWKTLKVAVKRYGLMARQMCTIFSGSKGIQLGMLHIKL